MKKKKFNIDQRKFDFFTGGKPCVPGRIRTLSKEEGESMMERLAELRKEGKVKQFLKYYPEITNNQIKKLIGTTDKMIDSIRSRSHWNMKNIKPRDVVLLGLCSQSHFNDVVAHIKAEKEEVENSEKPKKSKK